jgi:ATP-dependent DNA ligase
MSELFAMKTPSGQLDPAKIEYPTLVQPKLDGLRGICIKDASHGVAGCRWFSFTGKPLWNLEAVSASLPDGDTGVYDGEIVWPGHPFSDAYGLCKRQTSNAQTKKDAQELQYHCFDRLELSEWSSKHTFRGFQDRLLLLMSLDKADVDRNFHVMGVDRVDDAADLEKFYRLYLANGNEGLMAKRPKGLYHWKRHADWHRYKPTVTHDVRVIGVYEEVSIKGVEKGTLGGILVEVPAEPGFPEAVCKVGGGFKAAERKKWWTPQRTSKAMTYEGTHVTDGSPLVGMVVEVESKCRTASGALREPHFVRTREDK